MNFEERIDNAIREMFRIGYKPRIFMSMRIESGTIEAIKRLVHSDEVSSGFTTLWERKRLDLSMESIIQEPEWAHIFSDDDRQLAKERLRKYHFRFDDKGVDCE